MFIRIHRGSEEQKTGVPRLPSDVMCQMLITGRSNYALHIGAFSPEFGFSKGQSKTTFTSFWSFLTTKILIHGPSFSFKEFESTVTTVIDYSTA